ncbi:hypothetical protein I4U23_022086 [Adineta vaga]|nr:hypothetical protein I4U23_022086 [Adineta vaga]
MNIRYQQLSPIEHLHISHSSTFDKLSALISYTPKLHYLELLCPNREVNFEDMLRIDLNYLSIHIKIINEHPINNGGLNQFISLFQIQRNLTFDIEIYDCTANYHI